MEGAILEIDRDTLRAALGLYRALTAAEAVYQPCQGNSFRRFAQECLAAFDTVEAFRVIAEALGEEVG